MAIEMKKYVVKTPSGYLTAHGKIKNDFDSTTLLRSYSGACERNNKYPSLSGYPTEIKFKEIARLPVAEAYKLNLKEPKSFIIIAHKNGKFMAKKTDVTLGEKVLTDNFDFARTYRDYSEIITNITRGIIFRQMYANNAAHYVKRGRFPSIADLNAWNDIASDIFNLENLEVVLLQEEQ